MCRVLERLDITQGGLCIMGMHQIYQSECEIVKEIKQLSS